MSREESRPTSPDDSWTTPTESPGDSILTPMPLKLQHILKGSTLATDLADNPRSPNSSIYDLKPQPMKQHDAAAYPEDATECCSTEDDASQELFCDDFVTMLRSVSQGKLANPATDPEADAFYDSTSEYTVDSTTDSDSFASVFELPIPLMDMVFDLMSVNSSNTLDKDREDHKLLYHLVNTVLWVTTIILVCIPLGVVSAVGLVLLYVVKAMFREYTSPDFDLLLDTLEVLQFMPAVCVEHWLKSADFLAYTDMDMFEETRL